MKLSKDIIELIKKNRKKVARLNETKRGKKWEVCPVCSKMGCWFIVLDDPKNTFCSHECMHYYMYGIKVKTVTGYSVKNRTTRDPYGHPGQYHQQRF